MNQSMIKRLLLYVVLGVLLVVFLAVLKINDQSVAGRFLISANIVSLFLFGVPFILFVAVVRHVLGASSREDRRHQTVEDEISTVVQPQLRLMNIVEPSLGVYVIKDLDGKIVGHAERTPHLCARCGGELETFKDCPSCGAHAIATVKAYVFEGVDGARWGEIRKMQSILDAKGQLLADVKPTKGGLHSVDLRGSAYRLYDPVGKVLAEYHGDRLGRDYQLVTPSMTVVAGVHLENEKYRIYASPESLNPFLILSSVVLMDIMTQVLARQRELDDADD